MALILAIIAAVLVLIIILAAKHINIGFIHRLHDQGLQAGSKLMAAFLAGFIVFTIFTDKIPNPGQKIPIIIVSLLLAWANLFVQIGQDKEQEGEKQQEL